MKVIQYRFNAFKRTFGRIPQPDEPLFFAANCAQPQPAEHEQVMAQLKQAADATGVSFARLTKSLGL